VIEYVGIFVQGWNWWISGSRRADRLKPSAAERVAP